MISCIEFIPAYSEGFKFLEEKTSQTEPEKFWSWLSGFYLSDTLDRLVAEEGLEGCFKYWAHSLNEEAAGFKMTLNEIKGEFTIEMHKCPSKAMLIEMNHLEPYHSYCAHCASLYRPVVEKYGYSYNEHREECGKASCQLIVSVKKNTNL